MQYSATLYPLYIGYDSDSTTSRSEDEDIARAPTYSNDASVFSSEESNPATASSTFGSYSASDDDFIVLPCSESPKLEPLFPSSGSDPDSDGEDEMEKTKTAGWDSLLA